MGIETAEKEGTAKRYDTLIIGSGIAGMQAGVDIGDQGYDVLLVEKEASIGGAMISLSKVFPTLDCASCITTPKMGAAAYHPKIDIHTVTEVVSVNKDPLSDDFIVELKKNPRFVDEDKCIGCKKCEYSCPVEVPHPFEGNLGIRKAIYIPFSNAIPQIALLDPEACIQCGACAKACPAEAIDYFQTEKRWQARVKTIVVATGFKMIKRTIKKEYDANGAVNVIDALQMERLLAPHGPFGAVVRPSDGRVPDRIAYVQCAGSRDLSIGVPYCSRVCCMYAVKQSMLLSGAVPMAEITIYYMDIRAFGKGYEQFYQNAKAMGVNFIKAKVARITEIEDNNLEVEFEDIEGGGGRLTDEHDMVVLSLGLKPAYNINKIMSVKKDKYGFVAQADPKLNPTLTDQDGVFVAGAAAGPKDIVDTIIEASSAAQNVTAYLHKLSKKLPVKEKVSA